MLSLTSDEFPHLSPRSCIPAFQQLEDKFLFALRLYGIRHLQYNVALVNNMVPSPIW